jgi:hypothetical protein
MTKNSASTEKFQWPYGLLENARTPPPYDRAINTLITELDAPDGSTTFLLKFFAFDEELGLATYYAIEAPRDCPMRQAFEWGHISWHEYWTHKTHLYELIIPFNPGPVTTTFITPEEIAPKEIANFHQLGHFSPNHLKLEQLELAWKNSIRNPARDEIEAERQYHEFLQRCAHRFPPRAA